jgi:N-methylhydantoinase A
MKVRIGIDVGGTFTDAAAIDNETFELIGVVKTPTTHNSRQGVAEGIVQALQRIMEDCHINPDDVVFIAHGTTQATNALLEGDVAPVGIITLGSGLQGAKSRSDTNISNIELAAGKFLESQNEYVDTSDKDSLESRIVDAIRSLRERGTSSIVAAEAFSVDDPYHENLALEKCKEMNIPGTATNEISKLYGLKIRTRTAVVNASIMPKMLEAATMTETSIIEAGIKNPLMVMRCDGGVMTVDEVRNRPIMTILSGPAAGVAGALMYEKLTDGLFFEVGGTSTDISCVKDGKVMIQYAEVGGHKTYLSSLDVRTVGIGGGSMVQIKDGKAVNMGPRSAHIAGLDYEVYTDADLIENPRLMTVRPVPSDPEYAVIECDNGVRVTLTMAGAANIAGYVKPEDYSFGNVEAARKAWKPLADQMGCTVEEAAEKAMAFAAAKNAKVAEQLIKDYKMRPEQTVFVGGGGGAASVVPHLARTMKHKYRIAGNAAVISTIGVALAMVRDMVERTVSSPSQEDILSIRREVEQKAIQSGAAPGTIEIHVEVDTQKNLLRAIAVGATEMRSKVLGKTKLTVDQLLKICAENMDGNPEELSITAQNGVMYAVQSQKLEKKFLGLVKKKTTPLRLIDEEGVIRLQKSNALVSEVKIADWETKIEWYLEELTVFNDGGANLPNIYLVSGKRVIDLSGLQSKAQICALGNAELTGFGNDEKVLIIATGRTEG